MYRRYRSSREVLVCRGRVLCYSIQVGRSIRWYRSARRHRVGKAHALHVIESTEPVQVRATDTLDARLVWIGPDDRGIELEIVALDLQDAITVIHVMPTSLRRQPHDPT